MTTHQDAVELKRSLGLRIQEMADEFEKNGQEWKDDTTEANWEKLNADYQENEKFLAKCEKARQVAEARARVHAMNGTKPDSEIEYRGEAKTLKGLSAEMVKSIAFQASLLAPMGDRLSDQQRDAMNACNMPETGFANARDYHLPLMNTVDHKAFREAYMRGGETAAREQRGQFFNAPLTTGTAGLGGNFVPPESLLSAVEVNMLAFGGILQVADTITTATGEPLSWLTVNDTGNKGRRLAENAAHDDNAAGGSSGDGGPNPAFGKTTWSSFDYTSDTILVSYRLLRDSAANLPPLLGALIGERIGRILNEEFTLADGSSKPSGITVGAATGVTAASQTVITLTEILQLQHKVDPAYRSRGASFMCNDAVALHLRLKNDGDGRPLWQPSLIEGVPDRLLGAPLVYNHDMEGLAASKVSLLYGALNMYKVRRVGMMRFYRLTERYREKDQDGFVAMMSADGGLLNAGTNAVQKLVQAAPE